MTHEDGRAIQRAKRQLAKEITEAFVEFKRGENQQLW